jgi:hypothetical protein
VAYREDRKRKDGSVTYYVRWINPDSRQGMAQKMPSEDSANLLLTVLKAHANDIDSALESVKAHYRGVYTVSRMIEDHICVASYDASETREVAMYALGDGLNAYIRHNLKTGFAVVIRDADGSELIASRVADEEEIRMVVARYIN